MTGTSLTTSTGYDKIDRDMALRIWQWFSANRKPILITFEIFWIIVFLLEQVSNANSGDIPQFIYVNF
jgi:hypothetical protein